ncbi:hypothetical protein WR25_18922 [Diploscapter pachys]|uniref:Lipocalin/cytosolic fatty-acid binding domain-containing protein n=1 Tax=Diploscapter pachys TaxID=2018661 RepID=A0A2A2KHM7_9BILA|nr:hypothetical protein WR25_18922 [Diploscapter pachys]
MSIQDLVGKWRLENWENFEEFMKEGDNVTLDVKSTFKNQTVKSVLGKFACVSDNTKERGDELVELFACAQDFDEDTMDGRRVLSTITFENGKLIHTQKATKKGDQTTVVTRYREGDKMITIFRCNEVTSRWELSRV